MAARTGVWVMPQADGGEWIGLQRGESSKGGTALASWRGMAHLLNPLLNTGQVMQPDGEKDAQGLLNALF